MKVGELKRAIEMLDDDLEVIVSNDSEGNEFNLLADITTGCYSEEDEDFYEEDEEINAVCFWPGD